MVVVKAFKSGGEKQAKTLPEDREVKCNNSKALHVETDGMGQREHTHTHTHTHTLSVTTWIESSDDMAALL